MLKQDLFTLRQVIDQYTLDHQKVPASLEDLITAGYLKSIPVDPFTGRRDWEIEKEPEIQDPPAPGETPVPPSTLSKATCLATNCAHLPEAIPLMHAGRD